MKVAILIVTHQKHFHWLKWCLRSIEKYATGFHEVVVSIPEDTDWKACRDLSTGYHGTVPMRFHCFDEWPEKGFLHHEYMITCGDVICPEADFVLHTDPDCIFIDSVRPEDYFVDGKPVLIHARYDWIVQRFNNPNHYHWKTAVEKALGGKSDRETMRRHPAVHYRSLYTKTRELIQQHTGMDAGDYIRSTQNSYPNGYAEFPTLGEVARRCFYDQYHWIDQEIDPWAKDKLLQMWSHAPMDVVQNVWCGGTLNEMIPNELFRRYLT